MDNAADRYRLGNRRQRGAAGPGGRDDASVGGELGRRRYERGVFEGVEVSSKLFWGCGDGAVLTVF